jgi:hypothetical protein
MCRKCTSSAPSIVVMNCGQALSAAARSSTSAGCGISATRWWRPRCLRLRYRGRSAAPGRGSGSQPGRGFGTALNSETDGNFGNGGTGQGSASDLNSAARRENVTAEKNVTVRVVEPHRLVHTPRRWYLLAWDADRADWRTFRVDRIEGPLGPPVAQLSPLDSAP